jgi:hypothetical protein
MDATNIKPSAALTDLAAAEAEPTTYLPIIKGAQEAAALSLSA